MDSQAYIVSLSESNDLQKLSLSSTFVSQHINSFADLECLVKQCAEIPQFGANVYKTLSWELFDKVYALSLGPLVSDSEQHLLRQVVSKLCEHVRLREMFLMVVEKLSSCYEKLSFHLLLHAMEAVLIRSDSVDVWKQGLDITLRKATALCSARNSNQGEENDEDEDSPDFDLPSQSVEVQGEFLEQVLIFARILVNRAEELTVTQPIVQIKDLLIGFVLSINASIITSVQDPVQREHYLATTTSLLMALNEDLYHIFEHIYRMRHVVFRQELHKARTHFLRSYCNKYSSTQKEVGASTALTTDDANALHNRISQSEYCGVLLAYFDQTTKPSSASSARVSVNDWSQLVCWDDLHSQENITTNDTTDGTASDATVSWSLTGIALLALHVLQSTTHSAHHTPALPTVYNLSYLRALLQPYVLPLLRSSVANPEGLQLAALLLTPAVGSAPAHVPIFMSFLAQQSSATSFAHLQLSFYHCLPAQHRASTGKVFWDAQDAAKLGILTASTNNILSIAQTLVTAMAGCADSALRTTSFQCLRAYLKSIEERALFGLLLILTEQCPYPNMAGLLIDLTKECVQAACKGDSWTSFAPTHAHLHLTAGTSDADAAFVAARPSPWLLDSTDVSLLRKGKKRGFPLKRIIKAGPPPKSAADSTDPSTAAVDVDELVLVRAKKPHHDPRDPAQHNQQALSEDEDSYLDLRSGVTDIDADRLIEVREAMPFMWAGGSPFWSPLVVQRFLVEPLRDVVKYAEPQKVLEGLDIIAARVNLTQAFALKCLADSSLCMVATEDVKDTPVSAAGSVDGVLDSYFSGSVLYAPVAHTAYSFPYAFSKLKAVKDIFALYFLLKELRATLKAVPKSLPEVGAELDRTRVMLLTSNVEYAMRHMHTLCNQLHVKLLQTAE